MRRLSFLLLAIVAVTAVLVVVFHREREPEYGGKGLSEWVEELSVNPPRSVDTEAAKAILQIGTNAIPYLVKWISYEPPVWKIKYYGAMEKLLKRGTNPWAWDRKNRLSIKTVAAFQILGPDAQTAIPELGRLVNSTKHRGSRGERAADALGYLGKDALPALLSALTNQALLLRFHAFRGIQGMGTDAVPAVPVLMEYHRRDDIVGFYAGDILGKLNTQSRLVVPGLVRSLQDSNVGVRWSAAHVLGELASEAQTAVPTLVQALNDSNPSVRQEAAKALGQIGPGEDALPALLSALTNQSTIFRDYAFQVIKGMGTNAVPAVPILMEYLHKDRLVSFYAAEILGNLKEQSRLIVPGLEQNLHDSSARVRSLAAHVLGQFTIDARPAVPALAQALRDPDPEVRGEAARALAQIDPKALERATQ